MLFLTAQRLLSCLCVLLTRGLLRLCRRLHTHRRKFSKHGNHHLNKAHQVTLPLIIEGKGHFHALWLQSYAATLCQCQQNQPLINPTCSFVENKYCFNSHIRPLSQVRQHDFTIAGDILSAEDHHLLCGSDIADGSSLGVGFLNPQANRNVICYILYNGKEKDIKIREILNLSYFLFEVILL